VARKQAVKCEAAECSTICATCPHGKAHWPQVAVAEWKGEQFEGCTMDCTTLDECGAVRYAVKCVPTSDKVCPVVRHVEREDDDYGA